MRYGSWTFALSWAFGTALGWAKFAMNWDEHCMGEYA